MYETLCLWLRHCDRADGGKFVKVPKVHLEQAIRQAAKEENREHEQFPFETGAEHAERTQTLTRI